MYRHRVDVGCIVDVLFLYIHLGKIADIDFFPIASTVTI